MYTQRCNQKKRNILVSTCGFASTLTISELLLPAYSLLPYFSTLAVEFLSVILVQFSCYLWIRVTLWEPRDFKSFCFWGEKRVGWRHLGSVSCVLFHGYIQTLRRRKRLKCAISAEWRWERAHVLLRNRSRIPTDVRLRKYIARWSLKAGS